MPLKKPLRRNPSPYTCRDIDAAIAHLEAVLVSEGANRVFSRTYWRRRVLEAYAGVAEIRFSAPNKHHFLVDLAPFGLENNGEVFIAADRPYGLIEGTVLRDDAPPAEVVWYR